MELISVYTLGSRVFGMAGYAGVIKSVTRNGKRFDLETEKNFKSEGFQIFPMKGFSKFSPFLKKPPSGTFLQNKPMIFWYPVAVTFGGVYSEKVKVPFGLSSLNIRIGGKTSDGKYFSRFI